MKNFKNTIILVLAVAMIGCAKTVPETPGATRATNPYSITNIREALKTLNANGYDLPETIEPNTLHVCFQPADSTELRIMEENGIELFDYRLDGLEGTTTKASNRPVFYASIPTANTLPENIKYEILDRCYVPEYLNDGGMEDAIMQLLEKTAIELAGYKADKAESVGGRIRIQAENNYRYDVMGVKIQANYFVRTATAYTDADGRYELDTRFFGAPTIGIKFTDGKNYRIIDEMNMSSTAGTILGTYDRNHSEYTITKDNNDWIWAAASNAVHNYRQTCTEQNMPAPPSNLKIMVTRTKKAGYGSTPMLSHISSVHLNSKSSVINFLANIIMVPATSGILNMSKWQVPDMILNIGTYVGNYKGMYYLCLHELAHASHFSVAGYDFWTELASTYLTNLGNYGRSNGVNADMVDLCESWANGFENMTFNLRECDNEFYSDGRFDDGVEMNYPFISILLETKVLTPRQVLTNMTSEITNISLLKEKLCRTYPDKKNEINDVWKSQYTNKNTARY